MEEEVVLEGGHMEKVVLEGVRNVYLAIELLGYVYTNSICKLAFKKVHILCFFVKHMFIFSYYISTCIMSSL